MDRREINDSPAQSSGKLEANGARRKTLGTKLFAVGASVTLASSLAACGGEANEAAAPTAKPSAEAPAVPSETPAPTEAAPTASENPDTVFEGDVLERPAMPRELSKYEEMDLYEFSNLPKSEQLTYASWLTSYRDDFQATFSLIGGHSSDEPFVVTPETPADKILAEISYNRRMAAYMTVHTARPQENGTCGRLDEDAVSKTILAYTGGNAYSKPGHGFALAGSILSAHDGRALCPSTLALLDYESTYETSVTSEHREEFTQDDGTVATKVAIEYSREGTDYRVGAYIVPTVAFNGETLYSVVSNAAFEIDGQ